MTLFLNPKIYIDASGRFTDAILVRDGMVVALGTLAKDRAEDDEHVTIDAACVMPALSDAHIHLWGFGMRDGAIDLRGATSTQEIYGRLEHAAPTSHGWILASGWDQNLWSDRQSLDLKTLDNISNGRPMCLRRIDEHALWANSVALKNVGDTTLSSGAIQRDERGALTGLLVDDAMHLVSDAVPARTIEEDRATCILNAEMLRRFGITSAHIAWVEASRFEMLNELVSSGALGLRVHPMLDGKDPAYAELLDAGPQFVENRLAHTCAVKFFADGALGSQGAHLLDPYPDGSRGLAVADDELLSRAIPDLVARGWQVCIHAIGDRANQRVLSHFQNLTVAQRAATRPRVEHVQMLHDDDLDQLSDVIASIQPIHLRSDAAWVKEVLGEQQWKRLFRWRDILTRCKVAAGSDFPIEDPNPWHGISTAISRLDRLGDAFEVHQKMSRTDAIRAYTSGAAYAAFWEDYLGALRPRMIADMIGIDTDPFTASPEEIWETSVSHLYMGGQRIEIGG